MANAYFRFKQFTILQQDAPFKVGTDGVLLGAWVNCLGVKNTLDIGTGTGLIACMIAQRCESCVDAIEINQTAFQQALVNIENSPWARRISVHHCAVQAFRQERPCKGYDLIISNPPFYSNSLKNTNVDLAVARHDDHLGFRDLLAAANDLSSPEGRLAVIYPVQASQRFVETASGYGFYVSKELWIKPTALQKANRVMLELCRAPVGISKGEIAVREAYTNGFTHEYQQLTRDFYLYF